MCHPVILDKFYLQENRSYNLYDNREFTLNYTIIMNVTSQYFNYRIMLAHTEIFSYLGKQ